MIVSLQWATTCSSTPTIVSNVSTTKKPQVWSNSYWADTAPAQVHSKPAKHSKRGHNIPTLVLQGQMSNKKRSCPARKPFTMKATPHSAMTSSLTTLFCGGNTSEILLVRLDELLHPGALWRRYDMVDLYPGVNSNELLQLAFQARDQIAAFLSTCTVVV